MTLLTPAQLHAIMPTSPAEIWAPALAAAMEKWGIRGVPARAAFLAVTGEESGYFSRTRERLNYSAQGLANTWPGRFSSTGTAGGAPNQAALDLVRQGERAIANVVYAGKLGNGPPESGDGWDFRGGTPIQITFLENWRACAVAHGLDLDRNELAGWAEEVSADPAQGASCAAWFFAAYARLLPLVDTGDEGDFIRAMRKVGLPPSPRVTALWLSLWKRGREVLGAQDGGTA